MSNVIIVCCKKKTSFPIRYNVARRRMNCISVAILELLKLAQIWPKTQGMCFFLVRSRSLLITRAHDKVHLLFRFVAGLKTFLTKRNYSRWLVFFHVHFAVSVLKHVPWVHVWTRLYFWCWLSTCDDVYEWEKLMKFATCTLSRKIYFLFPKNKYCN